MPTTQAPAGTSQTPEPSGSTGKVGETDESLSRTVSFDAGGSGTMQAVSVQVNTEYVLPACTFSAPEGKVFQGWQAEKETEVKPAGGKIQITKDVTLKAVWIGRWAALQAEIANAKSGDVIMLSGDTAAEASDTGLVLNKPVTIDLCGFTLDRGKNGSVMEIQSGEVLITDSSTAQTGRITGSASSGAGGAIVVSGTAATLTINGGTIPGNSAKTGGAFYNAGTVIMNGGSISGNTASENYGGAVFNQGKCTVNGGSITDNTCGGGVGAALGGDLPYGGKKTERSSPSTSWKPSAAERTATGSRSAVLLPLSRAAGAEATTGAPSPTSPMKIPPIKYARIAADTQYL